MDDHWEIVSELERKAVEQLDEIVGKHQQCETTTGEYYESLRTLRFMVAGLLGSDLLDAIDAELSEHSCHQKVVTLEKSGQIITISAVGDNYHVLKCSKWGSHRVNDNSIETGLSAPTKKLRASGYKELI